MLLNKLFILAFCWLGVIATYILMAAMEPASNEIVYTVNATFNSQNMSGIIGVQEAVRAYPYYKWLIPAFAGIIMTAIMLKEQIIARVKERF